jgi:hypothetical protein
MKQGRYNMLDMKAALNELIDKFAAEVEDTFYKYYDVPDDAPEVIEFKEDFDETLASIRNDVIGLSDRFEVAIWDI